MSGVPSTIRFLVLNAIGAVEGQTHFQSLPHGFTVTVATHAVTTFDANSISTGTVNHGVVNIEATQSGVFCTAFIVDAADDAEMAQLHLVRINGHPGAEE